MLPSLDVYSMGLVVLFLFSEKDWWDKSDLRTSRLSVREHRISLLLSDLARESRLRGIVEQVKQMLDPNPGGRPSAMDCSFELEPEFHDV